MPGAGGAICGPIGRLSGQLGARGRSWVFQPSSARHAAHSGISASASCGPVRFGNSKRSPVTIPPQNSPAPIFSRGKLLTSRVQGNSNSLIFLCGWGSKDVSHEEKEKACCRRQDAGVTSLERAPHMLDLPYGRFAVLYRNDGRGPDEEQPSTRTSLWGSPDGRRHRFARSDREEVVALREHAASRGWRGKTRPTPGRPAVKAARDRHLAPAANPARLERAPP